MDRKFDHAGIAVSVSPVHFMEAIQTELNTVAQSVLGKSAATLTEGDLAKKIKDHFNTKFGSEWHSVIGKDFQSQFTCESKMHAFTQIGQVGVLVYKLPV
jgi:Dynein light chain type 1